KTPAKPAAASPSSSAPASSSPGEFAVQKLQLKNGKITVGSTGSQKRSVYDDVTVVASNVSPTSKFPVTISAKLPGGGDFKLDGDVGPINQANTQLTPLDAKLTVNSLNIASTGFVDPALGLGGILDLNSTVSSQNGTASAKGSKALLVAGGSPSSVPVVINFGTRYDLSKNSGVLEPSEVKIGNATS